MPWYVAKDASGNEVGRFYANNDADAAANKPAGGSISVAALPPPTSTALTAPVETAEQALARMVGVVDDEREALQMTSMTTGGAKKWCYAEKDKEWLDYDQQQRAGLLPTLLNALNAANTRARWPMAYAEVDDTGDTLAVVMARWKAGQDGSAAFVRRVEARAGKIKRALRAASVAQRPAIFNARTWPT